MEQKMSTVTCNVFNDLRLEGKLCDVIIKVNDIEFNAHKNILCGCSSYFRALFTSAWNNTEREVYTITGVSPDTMRVIIEYAYMCSMLITVDNVESLLMAADQLSILGIVQACCAFLEAQLCLENCIGICRFAEIYSCLELRHRANLFILHHFGDVVRSSDEFLELPLAQLSEIIARDDLNVKQEEVVFEAILRWISHAPADRKNCISVLLPKVRMSLMKKDYFMNNVLSNALVKDNNECKPVIISTLRAMFSVNIDSLSNGDFHNPLTCPRLPYTILLAIGGWSGSSPTNVIEAYDVRADLWVNVTPNEENPRAYHGAAYLGGSIYCVGGFDSVNYFNSVQKFDPVARTWQQAAPMHSRRCYVSVATLDGCLYAMGGFDGHERLDTVERYEPETNQWTLIAPMQNQRSDASATTLRGKVYICGGFNGNQCLSSAENYNPQINQWTLIRPMYSRRSGVGVISYGNQVYAVGGFDGDNRLQTGEAYNPLTNSWQLLPAMTSPRSNFGIEVVDDLLYVVGGFNGFTTILSVECYNEKTGLWCDAEEMAVFRSALSCCVVSGLPNVGQYVTPRDSQLTLRKPQNRPRPVIRYSV